MIQVDGDTDGVTEPVCDIVVVSIADSLTRTTRAGFRSTGRKCVASTATYYRYWHRYRDGDKGPQLRILTLSLGVCVPVGRGAALFRSGWRQT